MLIIGDQNYLGSVQQINERRVADGYGVEVRNLRPGSADLRPWRAALSVYTIPGGGAQRNSIYRMGRAAPSDTDYWLSSTNDVDYVRSLIAEDTTERTYYTGETEPRVTDNVIGLAGAPYPSAFRTLGVPRPSGVITLTITNAGVATTQHTRVYLDTFITDKGEEGAPNAAPASITCNTDATIGLSNLPAAPGGSHGITLRRVYVSTDNSDYQQFVQQSVGTTTASDNASVRGTILASGGTDDLLMEWLEPPSGLRGMIELWNGMVGGFVGKSVRVCEAYKPWAWPLKYENLVNDEVVGTGTWQTNWVVLTTGRPRIFRGSSPLSMTEDRMVLQHACVAKKSIVSVGHGVCWASPKGIAYVGERGNLLLTDGLYSPEQWKAGFSPSTIIGARIEHYYYGSYIGPGAVRKAFLLDTLNPENGLIHLDQGAYATFYDEIADQLYLLDTGNVVRKWDAGDLLTVYFKRGIKRHAQRTNPGIAKIISDFYPVAFKLFSDRIDPTTRARTMVERYAKTVQNGEPFLLPGGYTAQDFQYEVNLAGVGGLGVLIGEEVSDLRA